jgi:hypothetical protein
MQESYRCALPIAKRRQLLDGCPPSPDIGASSPRPKRRENRQQYRRRSAQAAEAVVESAEAVEEGAEAHVAPVPAALRIGSEAVQGARARAAVELRLSSRKRRPAELQPQPRKKRREEALPRF